jgi:hypothetical protein
MSAAIAAAYSVAPPEEREKALVSYGSDLRAEVRTLIDEANCLRATAVRKRDIGFLFRHIRKKFRRKKPPTSKPRGQRLIAENNFSILRNWRRGRDSNSRYPLQVCPLSRRVHSTALPPLRLLHLYYTFHVSD